jgi:hypothetical protein
MRYASGDRVVLKKVDNYGYLGREFHPRPSDKGRVFVVIDVETYVEDDFVYYLLNAYDEETDDRIELIDQEVELLSDHCGEFPSFADMPERHTWLRGHTGPVA